MPGPQKKKGPTVAAAGALTKITDSNFTLTVAAREERRADTRLLAQHLGIEHRSAFKLISGHLADFEVFGKVRFEIAPLPSGQSERIALLSEDQAYLLLTYSRNTTRVRALKVKLVKAFADARRAAEVRQSEYLPSYHALHDAIKRQANGSPNERWMHINANKALNQLAGVLALPGADDASSAAALR